MAELKKDRFLEAAAKARAERASKASPPAPSKKRKRSSLVSEDQLEWSGPMEPMTLLSTSPMEAWDAASECPHGLLNHERDRMDPVDPLVGRPGLGIAIHRGAPPVHHLLARRRRQQPHLLERRLQQ